MDEFFSIKENTQYVLIEKKSKFIANLIKVQSQFEAEEIVKQYKKKYHDARHNCVAYRVIEQGNLVEKSSDDGEPSGTAGAPMLSILQKNNLCNVLIVVTRYFGGILLGTGGLVRAYSDALSGAIAESAKTIQVNGFETKVIIEYNQFEKFQYYCKINEIEIVNTDYLDNIVCKIQLEESKKDKFLEDSNNKRLNILELGDFSKKIIEKVK